MAEIRLREAVPEDVPLIVSLIRELADYEKLSDQCHVTPELLHSALFGGRRYAEVIVAEADSSPAGFALFFHNFSTFLARPGIYLEDVFVRPQYRGHGIGRSLLQRLAAIAVERNCGRMEWSVLDWNESAIGFYRRLGAVPMDEWTVFRVTGDALTRLASQGH